MEEGEIEVDSIEPIGFPDITPQLAQASDFLGVLDLLKTAKYGSGENIYLVRFHYIPPNKQKKSIRLTTAVDKTAPDQQPAMRSRPRLAPIEKAIDPSA